MKKPQPIIVIDLFPDLLDRLIELMAGLSAKDWDRPTAAPLWTVKDVALHLLGDEIGILSRKRDRFLFSGDPIKKWDELVALINSLNEIWVKATRRLSPRVLIDLMRLTGAQTCDYFKTLDPYASGDPVDWAGPGAAPVWLDLAREYTERWHHQQQMREAVGRPGIAEPRYFAPVIDAFVRALPHTYRDVEAEDGSIVALTIKGDSGGRWFLLREERAWHLYLDARTSPRAEVTITEEIAWKLFTKGVSKSEARRRAIITGDEALAGVALDMISIIA
jgi:uncharacterized protein (TIGR03083 family)